MSGIGDRSIIAVLVSAMKTVWEKVAALMESDEVQNARIQQLEEVAALKATAGAPMLRDTVEAPGETPVSSRDDDSGDKAEPASTELQSGDDTLPHADEPVDNSEPRKKSLPNRSSISNSRQ